MKMGLCHCHFSQSQRVSRAFGFKHEKNCIAAIYIEPKAVLFFLPFFFLPNTHRLPTVDLNFENCVILASKQKPLEFLVCQGGHLKRNSFTRGFVFF